MLKKILSIFLLMFIISANFVHASATADIDVYKNGRKQTGDIDLKEEIEIRWEKKRNNSDYNVKIIYARRGSLVVKDVENINHMMGSSWNTDIKNNLIFDQDTERYYRLDDEELEIKVINNKYYDYMIVKVEYIDIDETEYAVFELDNGYSSSNYVPSEKDDDSSSFRNDDNVLNTSVYIDLYRNDEKIEEVYYGENLEASWHDYAGNHKYNFKLIFADERSNAVKDIKKGNTMSRYSWNDDIYMGYIKDKDVKRLNNLNQNIFSNLKVTENSYYEYMIVKVDYVDTNVSKYKLYKIEEKDDLLKIVVEGYAGDTKVYEDTRKYFPDKTIKVVAPEIEGYDLLDRKYKNVDKKSNIIVKFNYYGKAQKEYYNEDYNKYTEQSYNYDEPYNPYVSNNYIKLYHSVQVNAYTKDGKTLLATENKEIPAKYTSDSMKPLSIPGYKATESTKEVVFNREGKTIVNFYYIDLLEGLKAQYRNTVLVKYVDQYDKVFATKGYGFNTITGKQIKALSFKNYTLNDSSVKNLENKKYQEIEFAYSRKEKMKILYIAEDEYGRQIYTKELVYDKPTDRTISAVKLKGYELDDSSKKKVYSSTYTELKFKYKQIENMKITVNCYERYGGLITTKVYNKDNQDYVKVDAPKLDGYTVYKDSFFRVGGKSSITVTFNYEKEEKQEVTLKCFDDDTNEQICEKTYTYDSIQERRIYALELDGYEVKGKDYEDIDDDRYETVKFDYEKVEYMYITIRGYNSVTGKRLYTKEIKMPLEEDERIYAKDLSGYDVTGDSSYKTSEKIYQEFDFYYKKD